MLSVLSGPGLHGTLKRGFHLAGFLVRRFVGPVVQADGSLLWLQTRNFFHHAVLEVAQDAVELAVDIGDVNVGVFGKELVDGFGLTNRLRHECAPETVAGLPMD